MWTLEVYKYVKFGIIYVNMDHVQYMKSYDFYMKFGAFKINQHDDTQKSWCFLYTIKKK